MRLQRRWRVPWDLDLIRDFRHELRLLRTRPLLSALAILILAFGTGSTIAVFSFVDRLILRSPPYLEPDRVMTLWQTSADAPAGKEGVSPGALAEWRDRATSSFATIAGAEPWSFDYLSDLEPQTLVGSLVTEGFLEAIGVQPALGRTFRSEEHTEGRADVVILSHGAWLRLFAADRSLIGRAIQLEGRPHLVVGVLPSWFDPHLPPGRAREVWAPQVLQDFGRRNFVAAIGLPSGA
jgi:putative ABC transport system permease protein